MAWLTAVIQLTAIHRAVARVLLVEIWIHGWTRCVCPHVVGIDICLHRLLQGCHRVCSHTTEDLFAGSHHLHSGPVMVQLDWRREGLVAGLVYTLMVILTVAPMRRRFYELFFIIHTTLAL